MKVNVFANISGNLGYNVHARGFVEGMIENGMDVTAIPFEHQLATPVSRNVAGALQKKFNYDSPSVCLSYGNMMFSFWGKKRIGYTVWETTKLMPDWVRGLNSCDDVWTVSKFCKKAFEDSGVDKDVKIVHEGVDTTIFSKYVAPKKVTNKDGTEPFVFLTIGKWEKRKGYDILLEAFTEEFKDGENVALAMQCVNPFLQNFNPWQEIAMMNLGKHAPIIIVPPVREQTELASLYRTADCFVLPTRGESWGLPASEALACGVPVITTNWGGTLEYMNKDVGWLIDVEKTEVPDDGMWFKPYEGNEWAVPSKDNLKEHMRYAFEHKDECKKKGDAGYNLINDNFTWEQSTKVVKELLKE